MTRVLFSYIPFIILTVLGIIITLGTIPALDFIYPTFSMVRLARIGAFVQNIDILFIGIWVLGIFGAVTVPWFMACYITQKVFNLRDYRFLAAPSTLIIGVLSIAMAENNLEVTIWNTRIIPQLYLFFFILIPFLIFIITLFKPYPQNYTPEVPDSQKSIL